MYVNSRQDKHSKWTALVVWILLDFSIRYVSVYKPNTTLACFTWEVLEVRNFHKRPNHVRSFWGFRNDVYMQAQHRTNTHYSCINGVARSCLHKNWMIGFTQLWFLFHVRETGVKKASMLMSTGFTSTGSQLLRGLWRCHYFRKTLHGPIVHLK
jgi:hypothetical protein